MCAKNDVKVTLWEGYYKGPTYTEFPVTHFFYNKDVSLDYTYGNSTGIGNGIPPESGRKKNAKKGARSDENGRPEGCAGGGPRLKTTKRRRHQPRT